MSNTPLVNTTTRPCACRLRASAAASLRVFTRELDRRREGPRVIGTVDADVLRARLDAEGIEQAGIIEGVAGELVDGDVQLVGPFDEVQLRDPELCLRISEDADGLQ